MHLTSFFAATLSTEIAIFHVSRINKQGILKQNDKLFFKGE